MNRGAVVPTGKPKKLRLCKNCGGEFAPTGARHIFCTPDCHASTIRETKRKSAIKFRAENPLRAREINRAWKRAHPSNKPRVSDPIKVAARIELNKMVANGKVKRPEFCSRCHYEGTVQGHHPDYSKPLEVIWLCKECHINEHYPLGASK